MKIKRLQNPPPLRQIQSGAHYNDNDKVHSSGMRIVTRDNGAEVDFESNGITRQVLGTSVAYAWVYGTLKNALQPRDEPQAVHGPWDNRSNVLEVRFEPHRCQPEFGRTGPNLN